jgi:hypothetical protein
MRMLANVLQAAVHQVLVLCQQQLQADLMTNCACARLYNTLISNPLVSSLGAQCILPSAVVVLPGGGHHSKGAQGHILPQRARTAGKQTPA